jgi:polygalacturonase
VLLALAAAGIATAHPKHPTASCGGKHTTVQSSAPLVNPSAISSAAPVVPSASVPTSTAPSGDACYVTAYSAIPAATAACTSITLDSITVPGNSTINLSKLKDGSKVTFKGRTFWKYFDGNYPFIKVGGTNIEVTATEDAILDGNGESWWDGIGSNGGVKK